MSESQRQTSQRLIEKYRKERQNGAFQNGVFLPGATFETPQTNTYDRFKRCNDL